FAAASAECKRRRAEEYRGSELSTPQLLLARSRREVRPCVPHDEGPFRYPPRQRINQQPRVISANSSSCRCPPSCCCGTFIKQGALSHYPLTGNKIAHELPEDLSGRFASRAASLYEFLAQFLFDSEPEPSIFGLKRHTRSVPNGYTIVYPKSRQSGFIG